MEAAGLAVGVISLAGVFETCVELADYISLANNLGRDYEATYTRYLLLKSRLSAWRPCMNVLEYAEPKEKWSEERMLAGRSLIAIKGLLEDGQKLEMKYGLRAEEGKVEGGDSIELVKLDNQREVSESIIELERALDRSANRRQRKTSWKKKVEWAIRDRKGFDRLIQDLSFHIDELEKLVMRLHMPISSSIQRSIQTITSPATMQLLEEAVAAPDMDQPGKSSAGHIYVRNQVAEHARVLFGNAGMPEGMGRGHIYAGNQVAGNARVVFGNVSGESMSQFWGL